MRRRDLRHLQAAGSSTGLENADKIKPKERKHLTDEDFANGYRMACQTFVSGDVAFPGFRSRISVKNTAPGRSPE